VKTLSSFSPLQKLYPRQKERLQSLQVLREGEDALGASRATMVELPKQVHLQKDVGAGVVLENVV